MQTRSLLLLVGALGVGLGCESGRPNGASIDGGLAHPAATASASAGAEGSSPGAATSAAASASAKPPEVVGASQLLVAYKGAQGAPPTVKRSKDEAKARAAEALAKIKAGTSFEDAVKEYTDDAPTKATHGAIGNFGLNVMPQAFSDAAFALEVGGISDVVETPRGFFIVKRTK